MCAKPYVFQFRKSGAAIEHQRQLPNDFNALDYGHLIIISAETQSYIKIRIQIDKNDDEFRLEWTA